jgi:hypothetical protein
MNLSTQAISARAIDIGTLDMLDAIGVDTSVFTNDRPAQGTGVGLSAGRQRLESAETAVLA